MKQLVISILCLLLTFLAPIQWMLFLALYLVSFDTIFAMIVKKRINNKRKKKGLPEDLSLSINSTRFSKSLLKVLIYMTSLVMGAICDYVFLPIILTLFGAAVTMPFVYIVLLIIVTRELMSIDETVKLANNGLGVTYYLNKGYIALKILKEKISEILNNK